LKWFEIIKVEDIDFDSAIRGFGHYAMGIRDLNFEETMEMLGAKLGLGKPSKKTIDDFKQENIRINHQEVYSHLKDKLGKEPTEKQLAMYITRIIMHEGTHAGMAEEQLNMTDAQSEYGAFTGQFPESMYMRMKAFLKHPASESYMMHPQIYEAYGIPTNSPKFVEVVKDTITVAEGLGNNDADKEKIVQLEALARKKGKGDLREIDFKNHEALIRRWGNQNEDFVHSLFSISPKSNNKDTEKMAGAVTTSSAPSMFNTTYSGKKKKEEDEE